MLCREGSGVLVIFSVVFTPLSRRLAVKSRSAAVSDGVTAGQDALNNAAVEVAEDLDTSANIPSHILSIVLDADRRVLQSGCSFKCIPFCPRKTVLGSKI